MLLSEEAAASSADGKAAKMSELNTDKAYMKPEVEQEKLKGTGLLSEEHKKGRESLAKKNMRDIIVDPEMQDCVTPREEAQPKEKKGGALAMTGLEDVSLKQAAAQKGVANTAHLGVTLTKAERSEEQIKATCQSALLPSASATSATCLRPSTLTSMLSPPRRPSSSRHATIHQLVTPSP